MKRALALPCAVMLCMVGPATADDASVEAVTTIPLVIPADGSTAALLLVKTSGAASRVRLAAGRGIELTPITATTWSATVPAEVLLAGYGPEDVYRNFVGPLEVFEAGHREPVARPNLLVNVDDPAIPDVDVINVSPRLRCAPHVVNLHLPGDDVWESVLNAGELPLRFYDSFPDAFDFLNVIYALPSEYENPFHGNFQNQVEGIGLGIFDSTAVAGSSGRLLGMNHFPHSTNFDLASPPALHEIGHQWINKMEDAPALLAAGGSHWPRGSLARGLMGYNSAESSQGLQFPYELVPQGGNTYTITSAPLLGTYTPLDLYLMGLLPADLVPPFLVFDPPDQPMDGTVTATWMTIQDVRDAQGPRVPAAEPRTFSTANLVVSRMDPLTDREMAFFDHFALRGEATVELPYSLGLAHGTTKPFAVATQGLGKLTAGVSCLAALERPDLTRFVAVCRNCPPLLRGLDVLIRVIDARNEGVRMRFREAVATVGRAYVRADLRAAARHMESFLRAVDAESGRALSEDGARSLTVLSLEISRSMDIPVTRRH
jgi:hypothetical protein